MSLINDALKQARQAPPRNAPTPLPSLQSSTDDSAATAPWLIPVIVIGLIVAAIFFMGWAAAHNSVRTIVASPNPASQLDPVVIPVAAPAPPPPPAPTPAPVAPPVLPQLQGIFYSDTAPTAILDGTTVSPGDQFKNYRVKTISKYTVTLVGPDKKEVQLGMEN
jgi:hypothetical protein